MWVLHVLTTTAIMVHLVPHTHDDVGWLKTPDQYFSGQNNTIQDAAVGNIITNVVDALSHNPDRKMVFSEQAFFQRWWAEQSKSTRKLVKRLVKNKQLVFVNGGWCMHDEATTHYVDMLDQTTLGHRFLIEEFHVIPDVGWQLDPFGHSSIQASLLSAEMGFKGLFFGRIDYQDLAYRRKTKQCEFIWNGAPIDTEVFTSLTGSYAGNYQAPPGFNWGWSDSEPVQDNPDLEDYNVASRVEDFVQAAQDQAKMTLGEHIMFTMGTDFQYELATRWFINMDKIIKHVNADGRVQAKYSSPGEYVDAKQRENITWPTKVGDFFPYADRAHGFWTGYFSSRPGFKRFVRFNSELTQSIRQINALKGHRSPKLLELEKCMGEAQHHDAITGTEKQHVVFDYTKKLHRAAQHAVAHLPADVVGADSIVGYCPLRNESICEFMKDGATMVLWNPLAQARFEDVVELPLDGLKIMELNGKIPPQEVLPAFASGNYAPANASHVLVFRPNIPSVGYTTYKVSAGENAHVPRTEDRDVVLDNGALKVWFQNGMLHKVDTCTKCETVVNQEIMYYKSLNGDSQSQERSGAYIFRPTGAAVSLGPPKKFAVYKGEVVSEVHQTWEYVRQRIRLVDNHLELTYIVGPLPNNTEVISRFSTDIKSGDKFWTDANAHHMILRRRDVRDWPQFNQTEPIAGNYYPVTSAIRIADGSRELNVLTNTAAGGSSLAEGQVELMLHRRCDLDDFRGVGESLDEREFVFPYGQSVPGGTRSGRKLIVSSTHWLVFTQDTARGQPYRDMDRLFGTLQPIFIHRPHNGFRSYIPALPEGIALVTLDVYKNIFLVRIAHKWGQERKIDLSVMFSKIGTLVSATRMNASGTRKYQSMAQWKRATRRNLTNFILTISPHEVVTLECVVTRTANEIFE